MIKALAPGLVIVAALTAAAFAVSGRVYFGWLDVSERLLPFAALAGLLHAAGRHWPRARWGAALATGTAAAAFFVPPYAANFWDARQTVAGGLAVAAFVGVAAVTVATPRGWMPRLVPLILSTVLAGELFDAGNLLLAVLILAAALAPGAFPGFAAAVLSVGYLYGGVGGGAAVIMGGLVLLLKLPFLGGHRVEGSPDRAAAGVRRRGLPSARAVRGPAPVRT